jgi:hypothetical protein
MRERGHPKQHYDAGVNACPVRTAVQFDIPLIFYAEHGETEYGGLVLDEDSGRTRNLSEVLENQIGDDPKNWAADGISDSDIYPYLYPEREDIERVGVKAYYFSYFFPWNIYENAKLARGKMRFETAKNIPPGKTTMEFDTDRGLPLVEWWGKSDGSFEGFDSIDDKIDDLDFYMMYVKFGFGRATRMASRLIQYGHMTREQGERLVKQYDGEFPQTYLKDVLEYMNMSRDELDEVIKAHRGTFNG